MTREEAREELKEMIEYEWGTYFTNTAKKHVTALEMAIKELDQEPFMNKPCISSKVCEYDKEVVLDKIRAEIEQLRLHKAQLLTNDNKVCIDSQEVLNILDKYKAESEDE